MWFKFDEDFFNSPKIEDVSVYAKLVYLALLCKNSKRGFEGTLKASHATARHLARAIGMEVEHGESGLAECVEAGLITRTEDATTLVGWTAEEWGNPNTVRSRRHREKQRMQRSATQRNAVQRSATRSNVQQRSAHAKNRTEQNRTEEKNLQISKKRFVVPARENARTDDPHQTAQEEQATKQKKKPPIEPPQEAIDTAAPILRFWEEKLPESTLAKQKLSQRNKVLRQWGNEIRILHDKGYEYSFLKEVLDFALKDDFWSGVVQSGTSFKKHFDKILRQYRSVEPVKPRKESRAEQVARLQSEGYDIR